MQNLSFSDPVAYLKNFYDPLTPKFVDTTDYRTSDDNVSLHNCLGIQ